MKKKYTLLLTLFIVALSFGQPANDDCNNAELITVTNTSTNFIFDINTAVINNETICGTTGDYADVWYQFTMPLDGNILVDGTIVWNKFALYNSCGSTEIDCVNTKDLFTNLTSGNTYLLRMYRTSTEATNTSFQNFSIKAFPTATNDDCASSEHISVSTTATSVDFEIGGASVNNEIGCSGATLDYIDIWYDFTMPVNGNLYINASIFWNNIALYDGCGGTLIQCGTSNEFITGLTSGTDYKLRIFRTSENADNTYSNFSIIAYEDVTNDDCASAENITVSTTASTIDFEIGGASINNEEGCVGTTTNYADIWYDFTMPVNGNLFVGASIVWNGLALYDTCGGTLIQCGAGDELFTNLTASTNYKLRVFRTLDLADNNEYRAFSIQAFETVTNDDCASAENITVSTTQSAINFDIGGASINNEEGCIGTTTNYADIWYDFTMPVNGNLYVDATIAWNGLALYDTCGGTLIQCGAGDELFTNLTASTNYKLRVFRTLDLADNNDYRAFSIQAFEIINNDDCASAENITVSTIASTVYFGIVGATIINEVGCSGTTAEDYADVWYDFTMPMDGSIIIDGSLTWNNFAIYDACNGNELGCFSGQGSVENLTNGTTYKLRVFRPLALINNNSYKSFTIESAPTLSTNSNTFENSIVIYPNPTNGILNISSETTVDSILIYDILGKIVAKTSNQNSINLEHLNASMYIVKVKSNNSIKYQRIILE
ncbi:T9SS type A sorting domain-containing protein [Psychroserpens luteus]|uniref:T9SS type A sorting domain-containing protein n=1 Tax=Psychroserpens luteus TaxID=1434066 RepID=A0ABW5ZPZ1_9FLAO|nr:T9SS type A sorting domain-containing protein [Psychroserpens luteus]